ncbi:MAG: helix-turn-helix transcriptional regulator [Eubacteriales bacterium]|nr:helix-turn-helix transcriptional regulator [Eubacteriales bacterium]
MGEKMKNEVTALRLRKALSDANMRPQELAERSGVSKSSISQYLNGSHAPSNISSGKMGKVLNVNPLYLMGFEVPMEVIKPVTEEEKTASFIGSVQSIPEPVFKKKVIAALSQLTDEQWTVLEEIISLIKD